MRAGSRGVARGQEIRAATPWLRPRRWSRRSSGRHDGNDAPRKKIILKTTKTSGNVTLTRNNTKVKVFTAASGGTEITFDGTDNKFPVGDLPKDLYVQGDEASDNMRDVTLTLTHDDNTSDTVKFTVLWITIATKHDDEVSDDNSGRDTYKALRMPPSYDLGFGRFTDYSNDIWIGHGSDFTELKWFRCSSEKEWYSRASVKLTGDFEKNTVSSATANTLKRNDATWTADEWEKGLVYITAGPGIGQTRLVTGNTTDTLTIGPDWTTNPTNQSTYCVVKQASWSKLEDVSGDNQNGDGTTNLSWNLQ